MRSARRTPRDLTTLADRKIKRRLESMPGVAKAKLVGSSKREVAVNLDPARLQALDMGVDEVVSGLGRRMSTRRSAGSTTGTARCRFGCRASPRTSTSTRDGDRTPRHPSDHPRRRRHGGRRRRGARSLALVNGEPAVALDITKQTKANTVEVVDAVKSAVAELAKEMPAATEIQIVEDTSTFIRDSVATCRSRWCSAACTSSSCSFLNSWRSTVITGLTLPISVISSFIVMYFLNMTLNTLTLMALSLAIGLLIDDAIVVRENIVRHLEHGEDHFTAAREGTSEIGLAVLATSMSIIAVFVPVAFMKGIIGRFFFQFGLTVAFAVLVSLFVSFTLDPMLSSRWYDPDIERAGLATSCSVGWTASTPPSSAWLIGTSG